MISLIYWSLICRYPVCFNLFMLKMSTHHYHLHKQIHIAFHHFYLFFHVKYVYLLHWGMQWSSWLRHCTISVQVANTALQWKHWNYWNHAIRKTRMNCWEAIYMHAFDHCNLLIVQQQVNDINPLHKLAHTSHGQLCIL